MINDKIMKLNISRDLLLKPLSAVVGVVEKRQTFPILGNVHVLFQRDVLQMTGTDLEVELQSRVRLETSSFDEPITFTVQGRKFFDICRSLPEGEEVELILEEDKLTIRAGRSRFNLATLPAEDFPLQKDLVDSVRFTLSQKILRRLTSRTSFAMAQQDVRYYLNGMLLEVTEGVVRTVATDGHRLAFNSLATAPSENIATAQIILPRKGVLELMHLIEDADKEVMIELGNAALRLYGEDFTFTSKLIDGRFPDYERVLPKNGDKTVVIDRLLLKQALSRVAILSNEKVRGVRLEFGANMLKIFINNPEHEEAEEKISIVYAHEPLEFGFNVTYLLDILNAVEEPYMKMTFLDTKNSVLLEAVDEENHQASSQCTSLFVVMPMVL